MLREAAPHLVHVHNLFPNFGRSWVRRWPGPLVATLHNFRPLCAGATLYRDGAPCTSCPAGDRWAGLRHGCYRDSRLATLPLAWAGRHGLAGDPLVARADRLVLLSDMCRDTYVRAGVAPRRAALIPNFVPDGPWSLKPGKGWVFVGRLSPEKGIQELLRLWPADEPLDVIGDGPLSAPCRAEAPAGVRFLGALPHSEVRALLPKHAGLVFPSLCAEGAPLVYLEALAAGLPVLALRGSAVSQAVDAQNTGRVIGWDEPLSAVLRDSSAAFPGLRLHCRDIYEQHYSESVWSSRMTELYRELTRHQNGPAQEISGGVAK
ncbi:glycosyltransferase family 4 protein [Streptomyces violascens]